MSDAVAAMLQARSVAVVGASSRVGSFGARMVHEVTRSTAPLDVHLVNPRYQQLHGRRCVPTLDDIEGPVDLVLLGVPDSALEDQLTRAARRGDRSAVIFGSVVEQPQPGRPHLTARLATIAREAEMALCGGGCMGFVNVGYGLRAIGYVERDELPTGPVVFLTHSGSAFSAMLRTRRRIGFTLAVSSGQELVTTTADYLHHALDTEGTGIIAMLQETMRDTPRLRTALERAAAQDVPVVALTVGGSPVGREMVAAHSGAIAGDDAAWEALFDAYGVLRVRDLDEMADTLELFGAGRRAAAGAGIATAHDSGAERTLVVDVAHDLGVPFAALAEATRATLAELIEPGLIPMNPLDVWGTGADTHALFTSTLTALAGDPEVAAVALAVDLAVEHDGDDAYPRTAVDV
ncbi:MAG: CoA-binding protein, partial [Candidatus Nanopelagicales bacterium]